MKEPGSQSDLGAERTTGILSLLVLVGCALPMLGLLAPTREYLGVDEVTLSFACGLVVVALLTATLAYRRLGPAHRVTRALDIAETTAIQGACQCLVFFSTVEVSPLWFLAVAHVSFLFSLIGSPIMRPTARLIIGITGLHAVLQVTVRGSPVGGAVALIVLALVWAITQLPFALERRLNAAESARLAAERSLAEVRLQEHRARIARDLHDTVGADLAAILWSSVAIKGRSSPEARQELDALGAMATRAIDDMRTAVWALREPARTWDELVAYTRSRCNELTQNGPELVWDVRDVALEVSVERAAHIVRATLEAVRNAVHHAGAERVTVTLSPAPRLRLEVADDGHGFVDAQPHVGQGLASLRERASALGGTLDIRTSPGGTSVVLDAPA